MPHLAQENLSHLATQKINAPIGAKCPAYMASLQPSGSLHCTMICEGEHLWWPVMVKVLFSDALSHGIAAH